jgi:hypothetical protein
MATKLPYVNQPGSIVKILEKVRHAQTPERFTTDFLETKLGFRGGNYRQFMPLAKKLGFLGSDGRPTDTYRQFRNDATSGAAMAQALRLGYRELFERNEYAHSLSKEQFKGLVVEVTGLASDSRVVQLVCQTFEGLKKLADFDVALPKGEQAAAPGEPAPGGGSSEKPPRAQDSDISLNLAYTINLVLPKSDDPAVFNAIFRALRDNLLRK